MRATYSKPNLDFMIFSVGCWMLFASIFPLNGLAATASGYLDMCQEGNSSLHCEEIKKICSWTESVVMPIVDKPSDQERQSLKGCSSKKLYYGFGKSPDQIKARKCAYLEYEQGGEMDESFYGSSILMMIYANGEGVKKNLDLALKFACEDGGGAIAEYEGHILHLEQLRDNTEAFDRFDYCNDSQSLLMTGRCADRDAEISRIAREEKFSKLVSSSKDFERKDFEELKSVWQGYFFAHDEEIDHSGTMGVADGIYEKQTMEDDFLMSLTRFEQGNFPSFSDEEFTQVDRELNRIYKKIQNATEDDAIEFSWGTVTKEKIKKVQRAWLKYRDAWVEFAKHKYPTVSSASWKVWLTRDRVEQLKLFIEQPN